MKLFLSLFVLIFISSCADYEYDSESSSEYRWNIVGHATAQFREYSRCMEWAKQLFPDNPKCIKLPYRPTSDSEDDVISETKKTHYWQLVTTNPYSVFGEYSSPNQCYAVLAQLTTKKINGTCYKKSR